MKRFLIILIICCATGLSAQEQEEPLPESWTYQAKEQRLFDTSPKVEQIKTRKIFGFGSASLASGGGISYRTREDGKGRAFDLKYGYMLQPLTSSLHAAMFDYNFIAYRAGTQGSAPYFSWGIGAAILQLNTPPIPYIPIRIGYEFPYGFVDLGAKCVMVVLPIPEIRLGFGISF